MIATETKGEQAQQYCLSVHLYRLLKQDWTGYFPNMFSEFA